MTEPLPQQIEAKPRLPIEVCEHVIAAVYAGHYTLVLTDLATLCSCALVCRAWRSQAQKVLFRDVMLPDKNALNRFAALVDASPELGSYVGSLELRGHLHVPSSPAVLFLTVLRGRLANLSELYIHGFDEAEKASAPLPHGAKELPCLPIHRYLPSLLTSVSHIRTLDIADVRFPSFGDFARFLDTLPNLKELTCYRVSWGVLGREPTCMAKRSSQSRCGSRGHAFLPNLVKLQCIDMDEPGRQRLLSAVGRSLQTLWINFPNAPHSESGAHASAVEQADTSLPLELRLFPNLDRLELFLGSGSPPHAQTFTTLRDTLASWASSSDDRHSSHASPSPRRLYLRPMDRERSTRAEFVELLRAVGPIIEAALCRSATAEDENRSRPGGDRNDHPETDPCAVDLLVGGLGDRLEWKDWWGTAVAECFPTFARWNRFDVYYQDGNRAKHWKDDEKTPQDYARASRRGDAMVELTEARRRRRRKANRMILCTRGIRLRARRMRKRF